MNSLKFQEEYSAKIPALTLLAKMGWTFISPEQALKLRGNSQNEVVLVGELRRQLQKRQFEFHGERYSLSQQSIDTIVANLQPQLNEGLTKANEKIYNALVYGVSVTEIINGKKAHPTISIIDWDSIDNNSFLFTDEFSVTRNGGVGSKRPDIVCFVNGLPLAVIEAKRPDGHSSKGPTVKEGITQSIGNQHPDEIPHLFAYSQVLLSISGNDGRYATCGTPYKFWAAWREEDFSDEQMAALKNKPLEQESFNAIFDCREDRYLNWYQSLIAGGDLALTQQDRLLISLLTPARLLEISRYFVLFDSKIGKIVARYQQFFGTKKLMERVQQKDTDGSRQGGVIWHTTGSGKSLTMVFLSKALLLNESLKQCRIVVITDRKDLETQLSATFTTGGELEGKKDKKDSLATSGRMLAKQIGQGHQRIIFSLIQKFNSAARLPECHNDSPDIIVLIDEGHRSQDGENHIRMRQALPNASFVAFTGTPLLKDDKTTNKFGSIIHAYTMQRAVEDKAVTPLLYEERIPDLNVNERAIDAWFKRITQGLSEEQVADLKRQYAKKSSVYGSEDRIKLIAADIASHIQANLPEGQKAQLACDSKASAVKYKKQFDELGVFESAVVMSAPDMRQGHKNIDDVPEVIQWWNDNIGNQDEGAYTKDVVKRFDEDPNLKLLIVVDKLLTGFDEPKNTVLYIDKPLKEHNLIQAIARVNRLHPDKKFGYLIDYRGILAELDTAIGKYQDLAARTQGGYDIEDIEGLYAHMNTEYRKLPQLNKNLWNFFASVKNKGDNEQYYQVLLPKIKEINGEMVDTNQKVRDEFYDALKEFSSCLKVALQSANFYEDKSFSEEDRKEYKQTLKKMTAIRQAVQNSLGETIDYSEYEDSIKKLLDKHVVGVEVRESEGIYEVGKMGLSQNVDDWTADKTRNETDIIKTRVTKTIEQDLRDDPYAQEAFSKLLREVIEQAESQFDHPMKQYMLFKEFEEKVNNRELDDIPSELKEYKRAQALFGIFKKQLPETFATIHEDDLRSWIDFAVECDEAVDTAIHENSLNPEEMENAIRKKLIPSTMMMCKNAGAGFEHANSILESIIHTVRVGTGQG